jgi:hypothetical protein
VKSSDRPPNPTRRPPPERPQCASLFAMKSAKSWPAQVLTCLVKFPEREFIRTVHLLAAAIDALTQVPCPTSRCGAYGRLERKGGVQRAGGLPRPSRRATNAWLRKTSSNRCPRFHRPTGSAHHARQTRIAVEGRPQGCSTVSRACVKEPRGARSKGLALVREIHASRGSVWVRESGGWEA